MSAVHWNLFFIQEWCRARANSYLDITFV